MFPSLAVGVACLPARLLPTQQASTQQLHKPAATTKKHTLPTKSQRRLPNFRDSMTSRYTLCSTATTPQPHKPSPPSPTQNSTDGLKVKNLWWILEVLGCCGYRVMDMGWYVRIVLQKGAWYAAFPPAQEKMFTKCLKEIGKKQQQHQEKKTQKNKMTGENLSHSLPYTPTPTRAWVASPSLPSYHLFLSVYALVDFFWPALA